MQPMAIEGLITPGLSTVGYRCANWPVWSSSEPPPVCPGSAAASPPAAAPALWTDEDHWSTICVRKHKITVALAKETLM